MKRSWKALAGLSLVCSLAVGHAQTSDAGTNAGAVQSPDQTSIQAQIEKLRQAMDAQRAQIDRLQRQLEENNAKELRTEQTKITAQVQHPDALRYKGITLSPKGSFIEAATVYRSAATGGGINTALTGVPLDNSDAAQMSEFFGSGRQSRLALKATGELHNMKLTGYYEMDWLGAGITSNNNQSNSYVLRQRQLWAQAALSSGWTFTGGQMWSLAAETTQGMENGTEILPGVIDPQYTAGFVWARQYGFRVTKGFNHKFWLGVSAENAQTLNPAGSNLPTNLLIGSAGTGGGLFNPTANYSFNLAPDLIAKATWEPGWGHYELFGIARFFRDRVYPAKTSASGAYNDSTVAGGIGGGFRVPLAAKRLSVGLKGLWGEGVGRYGDSTIADITLRPDGQIAPLRGFSALGTVEASATKRLSLYFNYGGDYVGRRYWGNEGYGSPLINMTGCGTEPAPAGSFSPNTPADCSGNNKDVQELSSGYWYDFYSGSKGRLRQGIQYSYIQRNLWSGIGGSARGGDNIVETSFRYYLP
jgi:hypothetical protein